MPSIISAGTSSNTALNFSGDTSGVLQLASNTGTAALTIDTSQNVGIGTTSPTANLTIRSGTTSGNLSLAAATGGGGASRIIMGNADSGGTAGPTVIVSANRVIQFGVGDSFTSSTGGTFTERMRIDSSGNVGIGNSSPNNTLSIQASAATVRLDSSTGTNAVYSQFVNTAGSFYVGRDASNGGIFGTAYASVLYSEGAYPMNFYTGGSERMRIDSSGRVNINSTTNLGGILQVNGNIAPTALASSYWGIDFGTSTSAGSYITLANGATYALASGAGCIWVYEQSSNVGLCAANCAYGAVYIFANPQNQFTNTSGTASKTNIYYDVGTGKYTIQNNSGATYSYWVATMKIRATS